ncbi:MAG: hypothetical protein VB137_07230 [Burkholderia sp.]
MGLWGADGAKVQTVDGGPLVWIFTAVDHCDAACVEIHVTKVGDRFAALEPISQWGTSSSDRSKLTPDADCPCEWITARSTGRTISEPSSSSGGITPSYAFVAELQTHGVAERFNRTMEEHGYPRAFVQQR